MGIYLEVELLGLRLYTCSMYRYEMSNYKKFIFPLALYNDSNVPHNYQSLIFLKNGISYYMTLLIVHASSEHPKIIRNYYF